MPARLSNPISPPGPDLAAARWHHRVLARLTLRPVRPVALLALQRYRRAGLLRQGASPFTAQAPDGARLDGLWLQPRAPQGLPVLIVHGFGEVKELYADLARVIARQGHPVFLIDQRSHGRSEGRFTTFGVTERFDLQAVVDHAERAGWIDGRGVITVGHSLGAATVLAHASVDERVRAVVASAPFSTFARAIESYREQFGCLLDANRLQSAFRHQAAELGFDLDEASTLDAAARVTAPVLMPVATRDLLLPPEHHAWRVAEALTETVVRVLNLEQGDHFNLLFRWRPGLRDALLGFLARAGHDDDHDGQVV